MTRALDRIGDLGARGVTPWFALFAIMRAVGVIVLPPLFLLGGISIGEEALGLVAVVYAGTTVLVLARVPRLQRSRAFWAVDIAVVLALMLAYGEWRSPFYTLALSTLVLPTTALPPRRALTVGGLFVAGYVAVALALGLDWGELRTTARLQSFAALMCVPIVVILALTFAADLLGRLESERQRSERLALEAERRRIAWELHDSAKQRIHAAHLLLSASVNGAAEGSPARLALEELHAATLDMDTSLRDLREPLLGESSLGDALRQWAERLDAGSPARFAVVGDAPPLPPLVAAHVYRIGREALTNAARHSAAQHVELVLACSEDRLHLAVADDGIGIADGQAEGGGIRSMHNRARALAAELTVTRGEEGRGTVVALHVPIRDLTGERT